MQFLDDALIPITPEVSLKSSFIRVVAYMVFSTEEFFILMSRLIDEAAEELANKTMTFQQRLNATHILTYQKLWNEILEKGEDNNV